MRLRSPKKRIDWSILIGQIQTDTHCSLRDLESVCGFGFSTLSKVKGERAELTHADQTIDLLMVFFLNTDRDIPILGKHYAQNINQ
jgi:hypothetical protein